MDKRLPLAMLLSLAVWFIWLEFFGPPPSQPDTQGPGTTIASPADGGASAADEPAVTTPPTDVEGRVAASEEEELTIVLEAPASPAGTPEDLGPRGLWQATFSNRGGVLKELRTGHYVDVLGLTAEQRADPEHWPLLVQSVPTGDPNFAGATGSLLLSSDVSSRHLETLPFGEELWEMQLLGTQAEPLGVEFRLAPGSGVELVKRFELSSDSKSGWEFDLTLSVTNLGGLRSGPAQFVLTPGAVVPAALDDTFYQEPRAIAAGPAGETDPDYDSVEFSDSGDAFGGLDAKAPLAFVGTHNKYFAILLRGRDAESAASLQGAKYRRLAEAGSGEWQYVFGEALLQLSVPAEGQTRSWSYRVYAGPKDPDIMVADNESLAMVTDGDLNWFSGIGKLLLGVLRGLEKVTGNFGWAIILMTLCIRALLFPLNRRSQTSMARYQTKMKRVQPKIDAIKKKFANDRGELNKAQQKLMQEEGIFPPLGGCLPIFIQMPIFFGLFSALRTSFDLRQAPFIGYIQDLSRPDALIPFDTPIDVFFLPTLNAFNLLPIVMVVMWVLQQATMPKPADEQAARMQRMMMFMPVMMGIFLYNYAAGLSLYMITQSTMGIFEQKVIKKLWPVDDTEAEKKDKKGCGPLSGMMEKAAERQKQQMALVEAQRAAQSKQKKKRK
ncbi:MAG: YidC/Oxa1 family insertase periplasmic-domain containing protein [Planctomycetota bacterium]|nr:YidC/Oxa1 family insertase periplasmic-domain containing protein [Planctomycetota bacterium]